MNPKIIVDPPGPKSKTLVEREKNSVSHAHAHYLPIAIKRGYGNMVEDVDGNTYCVRERLKLQLVADLLAKTTVSMKKLVKHMIMISVI